MMLKLPEGLHSGSLPFQKLIGIRPVLLTVFLLPDIATCLILLAVQMLPPFPGNVVIRLDPSAPCV